MRLLTVRTALLLGALGACAPWTPAADATATPDDGALPTDGRADTVGVVDDDGAVPSDGGTPPRAPALARLEAFLRGDFDNGAQHDRGFDKRVERHVCPLPGRAAEADVVWFYVEHVEVLADGRRDAYFTRVNEIREVGGVPVSRAYRFAPGHRLATNAFGYNGPRDGCAAPAELATITPTDLQYRTGCDVTFLAEGDARFTASTRDGECPFPGGTINTRATVTADGIDTNDSPVVGGVTQPAATFEFRRRTR